MSNESYHSRTDCSAWDFLDDLPDGPLFATASTRDLIRCLYLLDGIERTGGRLPLRLRVRVGAATPAEIRAELRCRSEGGVGVTF